MTQESTVIANGTLTSDCICEVWNDETGEATPAEFCYGDCFTEQVDHVEYVIEQWLGDKTLGEYMVEVEYSGATWRRLAGRGGWEPESVKDVWSSLTINGDFTLRFKLLDNGILEVVRSSHDELGAYHALRLVQAP